MRAWQVMRSRPTVAVRERDPVSPSGPADERICGERRAKDEAFAHDS